MTEAIILLLALAFGIASKRIGLPPLVGYLVAGFITYKYSDVIGINDESELPTPNQRFGIGFE